MPVLHLVRIMTSYSRKTINRMHTTINVGNYWVPYDVTHFMLKLKCLVAQLHLGLPYTVISTDGILVNRLLVPICRVP